MNSGARRFLTLDATRGTAAICVMFYHFTASGLASTALFPNAIVAIDYFFYLSGFLAFTYEQRLRDGMTAGTFMTRRLVRLYPMYLLGLAAEFLMPSLPGEWRRLGMAAAMALVFLPAFAPFAVRTGTLTISFACFAQSVHYHVMPPGFSIGTFGGGLAGLADRSRVMLAGIASKP